MPRLLLVEDDTDSLELLQLVLTQGGFETVCAGTVEDAVRVLERSAFDLVLADLMLEPTSISQSWDSIERLSGLARPTPLGLLTGWPVSADKVAKHDLAFVLPKPCSSGTLISRLWTALRSPTLSQRREAAVRGYFAAIEQLDYAALGELCTDDVVYELPGDDPRLSNEVRGREAFLAFTKQVFGSFRDAQFELRGVRPLPDGAMVEYLGSWTEAGEPKQLPGAVMFAFRGDRIARIGVRLDPSQMV